jgi:hypothetical protein
MVKNAAIARGMDLSMPLEPNDLETGEQIQAKRRSELGNALRFWRRTEVWTGVLFSGLALASFAAIAFR